jgi:hypothetical protein
MVAKEAKMLGFRRHWTTRDDSWDEAANQAAESGGKPRRRR